MSIKRAEAVGQTAAFYLDRKTRCTMTPTFRYVRPFIKGRTLDIGTGTGEYLETFPPGSVGLDVSEENIRVVAEKGLNVICADLNRGLPFKDSSFETVFCSHVIEHVDSPLVLLRESCRVLRRGGRLIIGVPLEKTLVRLVREDYFDGHEGHLYGLSVECAERLLRHAGFRSAAKFFNFPLINRLPPWTGINRVLQSASKRYWQYFCTMYWMVAEKI